jgi:hypothetical protein
LAEVTVKGERIRAGTKPKINRNATLFYREGQKPPEQQPPKPKHNMLAIGAAVIVVIAFIAFLGSEPFNPPVPYNQNTTINGTITNTTIPQNTTALSATIASAYCRYNGQASDGFPTYIYGTTGTATGPTKTNLGVGDSDAGTNCNNDSSCWVAENIECTSWSAQGSTAYCVELSGETSSTNWNSNDTGEMMSGVTLRFYVFTNSSQVLTTATATCPSCGNYPNELSC